MSRKWFIASSSLFSVVMILYLVVGAQGLATPPCEDRLRATQHQLSLAVSGRNLSEAQAADVIMDLERRLQRVTAERDALKPKEAE